MNNKFKGLIAVGISILMATSFIGCSNGKQESSNYNINPNEKGSVAVLIGKSRNNAQPALNSGALNNDIMALAQNDGSKLAAIELDGNPYVTYTQHVSVQSGASSSIKKQDANAYISNMGVAINNSEPLTAEVDVLEGLNVASRELTASDSTETNKVLYVMSNGIQTTGLLNMYKHNILDADVETIVSQIKANLPDMSSYKVVWSGIGDTADTQTKLDGNNKTKLKKLWSAIIQEAGSSVEFINDNTTSNDNPANWPKVSNVPIINSELNENTLSVVKFDNETISFAEGSGKISNISEAKQALQPIADILKNNSNINIVLAASTASWGTEEYCNNLSQQRNQSVMSLLMELGVNESQISTRIIGRQECKLRVNDLDNNGKLNSNADKNRAVFIINKDNVGDYL